MIEVVNGSIFDSGAQALVNPVNTKGVMGKGLALDFRRRFPDYFAVYRGACRNGNLCLGDVLITSVPPLKPADPIWIISFPTKGDWRSPSRLEWIDKGLKSLRLCLHANAVQSVAIPALGAGLGGLPWHFVRDSIGRELGGIGCRVLLYPPQDK